MRTVETCILLFLILGAGPGCQRPAPAPPKSAAQALDQAQGAAAGDGGECRADEDCAAVPEGCCDCRAGGSQRAATRATAAATREARCAGVMCPMVMSNHPTCQQVPRCVKGRCALTASDPGQAPSY